MLQLSFVDNIILSKTKSPVSTYLTNLAICVISVISVISPVSHSLCILVFGIANYW